MDHDDAVDEAEKIGSNAGFEPLTRNAILIMLVDELRQIRIALERIADGTSRGETR